ncbi:hypothetical protein ES705_43304 [subsurface metagenome]
MIGVFIGFFWGALLFGVRYPISAMPILTLCVVLAVFSTSGMGLLMGQNGSMHEIQILLLKETGTGLIYLTLGYMLFRWFETQAKKRGTLEAV